MYVYIYIYTSVGPVHIHAQSKSESDVKVDPVVKWIWSKVAITKSYHTCYRKCYHKVDLGANACIYVWVDLGEKGDQGENACMHAWVDLGEKGIRAHAKAWRGS